MYTRKVLFTLILDFFPLHEVRISMYMSKKADKNYMYYLSVLVKIKIRKIGGKNSESFALLLILKIRHLRKICEK